MNRILFEESEVLQNHVTFSDTRAVHVLNVLHGRVGQPLKTGCVNGLIGTSVIECIEELPRDVSTGLLQGRITVRCSHTDHAPEPWFDLILAPPRPRAFKRLLPQLVQVGLGRLVLVGAEKVEKDFWGAQILKESVYRPVLLEGLMQAGTTSLPKIQIEKNFRRYIELGHFEEQFASQPLRVVAHPYETNTFSQTSSKARLVIAVGPEGGWMAHELETLHAHGFKGLSLGSRILRTDTATLVLLGRLMNEACGICA